MADHQVLEAALVEMTGVLLDGTSPLDVLQNLSASVVAALGVDDAGVAIVGYDGRLHVGYVLGEPAAQVDDLQSRLQQGPCLDAFTSLRIVEAIGADELAQRWPDLAPTLIANGFRSAAAVPMEAAGERLGALNFYWRTDRPLDDDDRLVARTLAGAATVYVLHARRAADTAAVYLAEMERTNRELQRANDAKNQLLSRTSHELRTPLNAVLGFAQVLQMTHSGDDEEAEAIDHILRAGRHLVHLVDDILDVARIESGDLPLVLGDVPVADVVDAAIGLTRGAADERRVTINIDRLHEPAPTLRADPDRVLQVLVNLLSNAAKYNVPGGRIDVSCERLPTGQVRVSVTDTGPGLDRDQLGRLFMPFERLGAERTDVEGTGLGLALSRSLVEYMDGTLGVDSTPGHGSTFWFELPATDSASANGQRHAPESPPLAEGETGRHPPGQQIPIERQHLPIERRRSRLTV